MIDRLNVYNPFIKKHKHGLKEERELKQLEYDLEHNYL